jgi:hypothetical protein
MLIFTFALVLTVVVAAALVLGAKWRMRKNLTPSSRMRLSEREVAKLARVSVQRFLDDRPDIA